MTERHPDPEQGCALMILSGVPLVGTVGYLVVLGLGRLTGWY